MPSAFKITHVNGKFSHIRADDREAALDEARQQVETSADVSEDDLRREYGVTIEEISEEDAEAADV